MCIGSFWAEKMYAYFFNLDIGCNGKKHFMPLGFGTDKGSLKS